MDTNEATASLSEESDILPNNSCSKTFNLTEYNEDTVRKLEEILKYD